MHHNFKSQYRYIHIYKKSTLLYNSKPLANEPMRLSYKEGIKSSNVFTFLAHACWPDDSSLTLRTLTPVVPVNLPGSCLLSAQLLIWTQGKAGGKDHIIEFNLWLD